MQRETTPPHTSPLSPLSFHPTQYDVMDGIVDEVEKALKQVSDSLLDEKMEEL